MSSFPLVSRIRDYFRSERGVVPGLAAWRRRLAYPALMA
jgi:hypothetical protein